MKDPLDNKTKILSFIDTDRAWLQHPCHWNSHIQIFLYISGLNICR